MKITLGFLTLTSSLLAMMPLPNAEVTMALDLDHESFSWRRAANRQEPGHSRLLIWTRHKAIGIGNALGGYSRVMQDALMEDRTLLVRSIILRKFCEILKCRLHQLESDWKPPPGADLVQAKHFQIHIDGAEPGDDLEAMAPFYEPAGCGLEHLFPGIDTSDAPKSFMEAPDVVPKKRPPRIVEEMKSQYIEKLNRQR